MTTAAAPTTGPSPAATSSAAAAAPAAPAAEPSIASLLYDEPDPAPAAPQAPGDGEPEPTSEPGAEAPQAAEGETTDKATDDTTIGSMAELIEHYNLDPEYVRSLKVSVKVNGQTLDVPYSELVKSYQIGKAAEQRLDDAKTKAHAITQELAQKSEALQSHMSAAAALVKEAEAELAREFNAVDWKTLKDRDPAKYAADKLDFDERVARIRAIRDKGATVWNEAAAQRQADALATLKENLAKEQTSLLGAIPEWNDEKVRKEEKRLIVECLTETYGLPKEQVSVIADHRLIMMARDAMKYRQLQSKSAEVIEKVTKIPKVLKPRSNAQPAAPKETSIVDDLYG